MIFETNLIQRKFSLESALVLLSPLSATPKNPTEHCYQLLFKSFVFSKQTNYLDLKECHRYESLQFIEFLEFLCRFTITYFEDREERDTDIASRVYSLVEKLWTIQEKKQSTKMKSNLLSLEQFAGPHSKQKEDSILPELVPLELPDAQVYDDDY